MAVFRCGTDADDPGAMRMKGFALPDSKHCLSKKPHSGVKVQAASLPLAGDCTL